MNVMTQMDRSRDHFVTDFDACDHTGIIDAARDPDRKVENDISYGKARTFRRVGAVHVRTAQQSSQHGM